ncbi:RNA polymerase sigma factor SigJ [Nocardia sp. AG03]|uniref:RNA polymerase sigma factor SigJ n=1 Tax=Nocardia sp. AG03 TaxID=3025312 RepID=UPI002418A0F6|nr:RNA polymerase sigma factor SigJ [Nocardia sp. AG03]
MVSPLLADLFESRRAHLLSVAYRLTGSVGDAEDAVQEAWLRMAGVHQSEIEDLRAWLTTVVARICLDYLRSATVRRESYVGQWLPEPIVTGAGVGPLDPLVRDANCRLAVMVALDALPPSQRVAVVLCDGFGMAVEEIGAILDLEADVVRAAVAAGRGAVAPAPVPEDVHDASVQRFLAALAADDVTAVAATLHPEATFVGDAGGTVETALEVVAGVDTIARLALGLWRRHLAEQALELGSARVNGRSGLVLTDPNSPFGRPVRVLGFTVHEEKIWAAYDFANVMKLAGARSR